MKRLRQHQRLHHRAGLMAPALAMALLLAVGCMALVFDQIWLRTARNELQGAADAAALAAARDLAGDSLLLPQTDEEPLLHETAVTRKIAANIASRNVAGGNPVRLNPFHPDEIRIGRVLIDHDTGWEEFLETDYTPNHVRVTAHCDRAHGNPVSLFFPYVTGRAAADVRAAASATIDNDVVGVRSFRHGTVPVWPLAVLESHPLPERTDTWAVQIEQRQGADRYRFDSATGRVIEESDGLPEIILRCHVGDTAGNVCLVDLGSGLYDEPLQRQFEHGLNRDDLEPFDHELRFDRGPYLLTSTSDFSGPVLDWFSSQVGQARIILLYRETETAGTAGHSPFRNVTATRLAAARIMRVEAVDQGIELVLQPAVIATRTALLRDEGDRNRHEIRNPYIFKLSLTH